MIQGGIAMENIIPSSDLRNRYPEISKMCKETKKPVYITVNGRGDLVLLDIEAYQKQQEELELLLAYLRGMDDVKNGRVGDYDEMINRLGKELGIIK